jgi:uncharacterized protein (TIGR02266 family)
VQHNRTDKRYERRIPIDVVHDGKPMSAHTRNISIGGVFVDLDRTLPFGAKVSLKFSIPTQPQPVEVDGQVRWIEADGELVRGIGIRFEGLRARDVYSLNKFFETAEEAR